jgi:hypothetical protein
VTAGTSDWIALRYGDSDRRALLVIFNVSSTRQTIILEDAAGPVWQRVLATDEERYGGGGGTSDSVHGPDGRLAILLDGQTAIVYRRG